MAELYLDSLEQQLETIEGRNMQTDVMICHSQESGTLMRTSLAVLVCLILFGIRANAATGSEILKKTGTKGGIVVCIGADDPELLVGLAPSSRYLVHCLDTDMDKIKKARTYIQSKGCYGQISVDQFDGKTLALCRQPDQPGGGSVRRRFRRLKSSAYSARWGRSTRVATLPPNPGPTTSRSGRTGCRAPKTMRWAVPD